METIQRITRHNGHIAGATENRTALAGELRKHVADIRGIAEQARGQAQENKDVSSDLKHLCARLQELMGRFRLR